MSKNLSAVLLPLKMNELNINDLPREVMTTVFRFLNVESLKNATLLTCKLWNILIESTCRWSLELSLHDKQDGCKNPYAKMNFAQTTNRKFDTITISRVRFLEGNRIHKIFQRHGLAVVKLILRDCRIDNLNAFAELLSLTPNLKHVNEFNVNCHGVIDGPLLDLVLPDLKKLKILQTYGNDYRFIKCFRKAKLTTIIIRGSKPSQHYDPLVDFPLSQDMLTSLTVKSWTSSLSVLIELGKLSVPIPFRLTQLAILDTHRGSSDEHGYLLSFLKSQADHLEELEIGFYASSSVYESVFAMGKLKMLTVEKIPQDNGVFNRLKENRSVRTIKICHGRNRIGGVRCISNFFKKVPNVCNLMLPLYPLERHMEDDILLMAQMLYKLESVSMNTIRSIDCVKFPNLQTLYITHLRVNINWNEFTKIHSRLTELTIETMDDKSYFTSDDIDQITTNVDLQILRLGDGFVADDRFFEIVRTKCTNLRNLDLEKSCIPNGASNNVEINVLRLCNSIHMPRHQMLFS